MFNFEYLRVLSRAVSQQIRLDQVSVLMHPLVYAWARDRQDQQQQHESWLKMGYLVAMSRANHDFWRTHSRQLQPHVQALTSWEMHSIFASELTSVIVYVLTECGWLLDDMRDDRYLF